MTTVSSNPILSSSSISGDKVVNRQGEDLGDIKDLMIDVDTGRVAYAVLEFGGFLGLGSKLFAVPLSAMEVDTANHRFIFDQNKESLDSAPGFDKDHWPNFADRDWGASVHSHYGVRPYWE
ncbi:MAG: PRC-barrel domain-containing protein [Pseudohongiella sp.]|jgi:sporulation protein YlmC with PRC-barrel domain|nr:PRC-barrel domain-containing protein [Pseudohongiella sp.]